MHGTRGQHVGWGLQRPGVIPQTVWVHARSQTCSVTLGRWLTHSSIACLSTKNHLHVSERWTLGVRAAGSGRVGLISQGNMEPGISRDGEWGRDL